MDGVKVLKEKAAEKKKRKTKQTQPRASKRAETQTRTNEKTKAVENQGRTYELVGLMCIAVGLISLCGMRNFNVGFVGILFADAWRYIFGLGALPAIVLLLVGGARSLIKHKLVDMTPRLGILSLLVICTLAMLHHFVASSGQEILPHVLPEGGGLLGGITLFFIRKLFGMDGGIIVLGFLTAALVLFATNWSIAVGYLTTKRKAEKGIVKTKEGIVKTKEAIAVAGQTVGAKAVVLEEHLIEPIRDKLKSSFYNQDRDESFQEEPIFKRSDFPDEDVAAHEENAQPSHGGYQDPVYCKQVCEGDYDVKDRIGASSRGEERISMADRIIANRAIVSQYRPHPKFSFPQGEGEADIGEDDAADRLSDTPAEQHVEASISSASVNVTRVEVLRDATMESTEPRHATDKAQDLIRNATISSSLAYDFDTDEMDATEDNIQRTHDSHSTMDKPVDMLAAAVASDSAVSTLCSSRTESIVDKRVQAMTETSSMSMLGEGKRMNALGEVVSENRAASAMTNLPEAVKPPEDTYVLPPVSLILKRPVKTESVQDKLEIEEKKQILAQTLEDFKVKAHISNHNRGPAVTRYEVEPAPGVKVSKITNLAEDIALSLAAPAVRIEPIPGKAAIGIEVPNAELSGVRIREVIETRKFLEAESKLTVGLGVDIGGDTIVSDIGKMPHLLVAGSTGSGKSVCINTLITSILFKARPDEVKFILIDPKMVELSNYNGIPHLMVPVVTDAKKAAAVLNWAVLEMEKRYASFANASVRDMARYNAAHPEDAMPAIVIIIDELADLMMVAARDVEDAIARLTAKARAAGIHLILATQRPSVDVITGTIKNNVPSRIAFAVSSLVDSRTILDAGGAEKLLGKGDMLFSPIGSNKPQRVQGAFISDEEVEELLQFIRSQGQPVEENEEILAYTENAVAEEEDDVASDGDGDQIDELLGKALDVVYHAQQASTSNVQRRLRIGYTRAARIIDTLEELRIVGPAVGSKPRDLLMTQEEARAIVGGKLGD